MMAVSLAGGVTMIVEPAQRLDKTIILAEDSFLAAGTVLRYGQGVFSSENGAGKNAPRPMKDNTEPLKESYRFKKGTEILEGTIIGYGSVLRLSEQPKMSLVGTSAAEESPPPDKVKEEPVPTVQEVVKKKEIADSGNKPLSEEDPRTSASTKKDDETKSSSCGGKTMKEHIEDAKRHEERLWKLYEKEMSPAWEDIHFEYYQMSDRHPLFRFDPRSGKVWEWTKVGKQFDWVNITPTKGPRYWWVRIGRITYVMNGEIIHSEALPHFIKDRGTSDD